MFAAVRTGLILVVGTLVGGSLGSSWPLLFVISTLGNLIFISPGFAIAGRVSTVDAASNTAGLATTPLMFFSGSFFPVDSMRAIALQGAALTDLGSEFALIGAWIVIGLGLAKMTFRFTEA